jgi:transposase
VLRLMNSTGRFVVNRLLCSTAALTLCSRVLFQAARGRCRARGRGRSNASGLGRWRWVVERTFAWLNQFRRLRVRYEKRADIHEAFLSLGCALICWSFLRADWVAG